MSFTKAGDGDARFSKNDGLPSDWGNLSANCCPRCGEIMTLFEHLSLWKCVCGFKISCYRKQEIEGDIDLKQNTGFGFSNYHDDPPF